MLKNRHKLSYKQDSSLPLKFYYDKFSLFKILCAVKYTQTLQASRF